MLCFVTLQFKLAAQSESLQMRYDLKTGDEITYRMKYQREIKGGKTETISFREFKVKVVVVKEEAGLSLIGIQRNRQSAELLRWMENGKDRFTEQKKNFAEAEALAPPATVDVNRLDSTGRAYLAWSALREMWSEVLPSLHEFEVLPPNPVRLGETWAGMNPMQFKYRATAWDSLAGDNCLKVDGISSYPDLHMSYWYSMALGLLRRIDFEATYPIINGTLHEKLNWEYVARERGSMAENGLLRQESRSALLAAFLLDDVYPVETDKLYQLLAADDKLVQRQVLALAYRRGWESPSLPMVSTLLKSSDIIVRRLTVRMLARLAKDVARPFIEMALADASDFVRAAARAWIYRRLPVSDQVPITLPVDSSAFWDKIADIPADKTTAPSMEVPGITLKPLSASTYRGWPYILHVPDDYRGDEAYPLLVYLGGGPGKAISAMWNARQTEARAGYLIAFPHAMYPWWYVQSGKMIDELIREICRLFKVDTNRIYVAGMSNGGTGAFACASMLAHRFAAAVSLMGAGIYLDDENPPIGCNTANVPLLFVHGDKDQVISVRASKLTSESLNKNWRAAAVELKILKSRGHELFLDDDGGFTIPFLRKYIRNPFPKKLTFQARNLELPRHYWIRIEAKGDGIAEVNAEIKADNSIKIDIKNVTALRLLLRRELFQVPGSVHVILNGKEVWSGPWQEDLNLLEKTASVEVDPFLGYAMEIALKL